MSFDLTVTSKGFEFKASEWEMALSTELANFKFDSEINWPQNEGFVPCSWTDNGSKINSGFSFYFTDETTVEKKLFGIKVKKHQWEVTISVSSDEKEFKTGLVAAGVLAKIYSGELYNPQEGETFEGKSALKHVQSLLSPTTSTTIKSNTSSEDFVDQEAFKQLTGALSSNNLATLKKALNDAPDVHVVSSKGGLSIMMYYLGGTHYFEYDIREVLELMISEGVDVNRVSNSVYRATALNRAVDTKNREAVKILLDLGADVNIVGVSDNSSLLSALLDFKGGEDEKEIIRMLLDAGANLEATNLEEQYPEQLIAQYAHEAKNGQRSEDFNLLPMLTKMGVQITATANDPEPEITDVRMFYWDIGSGRSVPGSEAVVCSLEEALKTFDSIATIDGAFFGIVFPDEKTLQFMYDKAGQLYIEIPMPEQGGAMQKTAPKTEVLEMIKTAFENQDPTSVKGLTFEKW